MMKYAPVCEECVRKGSQGKDINIVRTYKFGSELLKEAELLHLP